MSKVFLLIAAIAVVVFIIQGCSTSNKKVSENMQKGLAFLEENKNAEGVQVTESGLQYLVLQPGTGTVHPGPRDRVKVHYHGTLIDGTVFDSSVQRGQPISFGLNQVIKGWTEGLQLMVVGEKARLFIPSNLAYGKRNMGVIKSDSTLIFDVELLAINR